MLLQEVMGRDLGDFRLLQGYCLMISGTDEPESPKQEYVALEPERVAELREMFSGNHYVESEVLLLFHMRSGTCFVMRAGIGPETEEAFLVNKPILANMKARLKQGV